jgi:hypothetical protein
MTRVVSGIVNGIYLREAHGADDQEAEDNGDARLDQGTGALAGD